MSYTATVYKVMIASPGDVNEERRIIREVITDWNSAHSEARNIVLMPIGWETHSVPDMGGRPQGIINKQILRGCDLLIGVFWTRIGTQTGEYDSGTVEEIEEHIKADKPAMLYFSNAKTNPSSINQAQQDRLEQFKISCRSRSLYHQYNSIEEFRINFSRHLQRRINQPEFNPLLSLIEPAKASPVDTIETLSLTKEALIVLKEASKDKHGTILMFRDSGGWAIQTTQKSIFSSKEQREIALWEEAVRILEERRLIEREQSNIDSFTLTAKGYRVADGLPEITP